MQTTQDLELTLRLARAVTRQSRGPVLVIAADPTPFITTMREHGQAVEVVPHHPADVRRAAGRLLPIGDFGTVLLAVTEPAVHVCPDEALLQAAWSRVRRGGRLMVCLPNPDALARAERGDADARTLRRLLTPFGRVEKLIDQPFAWLLMSVRRTERERAGVAPAVAQRIAAIAELCRGSVLELGCGRGEVSEAIARRGHAVVGVDLNEPKIGEAARRCPTIEFIAADICALRLGRHFDTVVLAEVLEHVPPEIGDLMVATARSHLAPGGRLIVSVPNENCIPHRNHVRMFDRRALKELLREFGRARFAFNQPYKWLLAYADLAD